VLRRQGAQPGAVLAVQAHDLAGGLELPPVVGGVVAEAAEALVGGGVAQRRGVEVDLGVVEVLAAAERPQHALQVADAHVVGDERQLLGPHAALGQRQVAGRGGQGLDRVEALVDAPALAPQALDPGEPAAPQVAVYALGEAAAAWHVHAHAEQVLAGLGDDLGQARGALGAGRGERVLPPGALQEDERLQRVGVHVGLLGGGLDARPPALRALRARLRAAGREPVQDVARARRGARLQIVGARGVPGEGVRQRLGLRAGLHAGRRGHRRHAGRRGIVLPAGEQQHDDDDRGDQHARQEHGQRQEAGARRGERFAHRVELTSWRASEASAPARG
jgi:hypothetical protein